jgi:hypothetical protein
MNSRVEILTSKRNTWHFNVIVQRLRREVIQEISDIDSLNKRYEFDELPCGMGLWYSVNSGMPAKDRYGILL